LLSWLDELRLEPSGPPWLNMGLARVDEGAWLLPDERRDAELALRARLLDQRRDHVFQLRPGTDAAAEELHVLVGAPAGAFHPLEAAGRSVQEDLCILTRNDVGQLVLSAACVCFPSHWRLGEKMGRPVATIHAPVPHYEDELAARVDGFIERLRPGTVVARRNWTIHELEDLYAPECPTHQGVAPADQWLRSERQTLRTLPASGAVVFTIKTQQTQLRNVPRRVAHRLAARLRAEPADLDAYKDLGPRLPDLVAFLEG
jgi:dimethylamine monooxygenase subunit A